MRSMFNGDVCQGNSQDSKKNSKERNFIQDAFDKLIFVG